MTSAMASVKKRAGGPGPYPPPCGNAQIAPLTVGGGDHRGPQVCDVIDKQTASGPQKAEREEPGLPRKRESVHDAHAPILRPQG